MESSETRYLMELTKDIVIAKLSTSAPSTSNTTAGQDIGKMYKAIYDTLTGIYNSSNDAE